MMADLSMTPSPIEKTTSSQSALTPGTWVLVADGAKALLLENIGDADLPVLELRRLDARDNPPTHDQGRDRPGRASGTPGPRRSALQESDWHRLAEDRFADDLAAMLRRRAERSGFKRLIIVAAPKTLGEMRQAIHRTVADRIVAELAMDLTNHPLDEIAALVAAATVPDSRD